MLPSLILFIIIIVLILIYLKRFTFYRCPKCNTRNIYKVKDKFDDKGKQVYYCQICKEERSK